MCFGQEIRKIIFSYAFLFWGLEYDGSLFIVGAYGQHLNETVTMIIISIYYTVQSLYNTPSYIACGSQNVLPSNFVKLFLNRIQTMFVQDAVIRLDRLTIDLSHR